MKLVVILTIVMTSAAWGQDTDAELRMLRGTVQRQAEQIAELKAEIEALKKLLGPAATRPTTRTTDAIPQAIREKRLVVGMTLKQAEQAMGKARHVGANSDGIDVYRWDVYHTEEEPVGEGRFATDVMRKVRVHDGTIIAKFRNGVLDSFTRAER